MDKRGIKKMSARQWYKCPHCKKNVEKAKEKYGKVPLKEFMEEFSELVQSEDWDEEELENWETVRMDGEEWLDDDGTYKIEHYLSCNSCGKEWEIKVSVNGVENKSERKQIFKIPSKTNKYEHHEVELEKKKYKCDCIGFKTRKKCSHIDQVKKRFALVLEGEEV